MKFDTIIFIMTMAIAATMYFSDKKLSKHRNPEYRKLHRVIVWCCRGVSVVLLAVFIYRWITES